MQYCVILHVTLFGLEWQSCLSLIFHVDLMQTDSSERREEKEKEEGLQHRHTPGA